MPKEIQPPEAAVMVYYLKYLSIALAFYLKERNPSTLKLMFLYAQEIEDNAWDSRNFSCNAESPSFVKDKRACEENIGISLQENVSSEVNKDFQKVSKGSSIVERQESNHSEDSSQNFIATTEQHYESMEDHCNNFVNSEENSAISQTCLQEEENFRQELMLYEEHQHYGEQTLDFYFQPKCLPTENGSRVPNTQFLIEKSNNEENCHVQRSLHQQNVQKKKVAKTLFHEI